jgi:hypothetical protein
MDTSEVLVHRDKDLPIEPVVGHEVHAIAWICRSSIFALRRLPTSGARRTTAMWLTGVVATGVLIVAVVCGFGYFCLTELKGNRRSDATRRLGRA